MKLSLIIQNNLLKIEKESIMPKKEAKESPTLSKNFLKNVSEYDKIHAELKKLEEQRELLKEKIIEEMQSYGVKKVVGDRYSVSYSTKSHTVLEEKKLKELLVSKGLEELYVQCQHKSKQYNVLNIKQKK